MADQELNDLFDLESLEEPTPFDLEEDVFGEEFETAEEGGGVSRVFLLLVSLIVLGVVGVLVFLVLFALRDTDELTDNQKTATAIAISNDATIVAFNQTLAALDTINTATAQAQLNFEATSTQQVILAATQQAVAATEAAVTQQAILDQAATQTALDATATQQAILDQAATQAALDATATQIAEDRRVVIQLRTQDGQPVSNVRVRLYRDDGDGEFNPADRLIAASGPATPVPGAEAGSPAGGNLAISYGEVGEGSLNIGQTVGWVFTGAAGDVISISAEAVVLTQMDTFLELFGPDGARLAGDDDSGEGSNALIAGFALPQDGTYTIEVSSIAGQGEYRLRLNVQIEVPGGDAAAPAAPAEGASSTGYNPATHGIVLVRQAGPTATPQILGDELVQILESALDGQVDLGSLPPGVYWLELDYDSLPPELKALVPPGKPLVLRIEVPEVGAVGGLTFEISAVTPTPSPSPTPVPSATATPPATVTPGGTEVTPSETPSDEPVTAMLTQTGFFSDISSGGEIEGTSGLAVLAIAAAGLIAVVFVARKLRTSG